ncbi:F0F1 ATP synthase subunit B [Thalassospiraceae bacterium LMO-JJ14]|nr:F0F1 ATP synthase subunit B [Thalassospiraceae bacterium LMO-JJ14]
MLHDPAFWVAVALVVFIIAVTKPVSKMATKALDERAEKIKKELDEAERLRNEAQDLLAQYQRKQRDAAGEAEAIIRHAKEEAERMDREGRERIQASLERREKLAMDRISMAEQQAIDQVRARAVEVAIAATSQVLSENLSSEKADALVEDAINQLPDRLH